MKRSYLVLILVVFHLSYFQSTSSVSVAHRAAQMPITGIPVSGMGVYDRVITDLMAKHNIPGGAVAVARDGKIVFAHGYGYADMDTRQAVEPDSLFRIASISKPITATAILKLAEEGRLSLDEKAFEILDYTDIAPASKTDSRISDITIRHLLEHSGGWDREKTFDPMFISYKAARAVGVMPPAGCETVIIYMLGQPLDFDPGTKFAYSNFGYCVLGRIIEKVTGQAYEDYVRENVLLPMGITRMRLGHTLLFERAPEEVKYYDYAGSPPVRSVFPDRLLPVSRPYGGLYLEAMDAHGGWVASVVDIVKFALAVDPKNQNAFLSRETIEVMLSHPPYSSRTDTFWYGLGWFVRVTGGGEATIYHTGALPGTSSILVRTPDGIVLAALFNSQPKEKDFFPELDQTLRQASKEVTPWPSHDSSYSSVSDHPHSKATATQPPLRITETPAFITCPPIAYFPSKARKK